MIMRVMKSSNLQFVLYMLLAFALAWAFQVVGSYATLEGEAVKGKILVVFAMLMPLLSVVLTLLFTKDINRIKEIGWVPNLKGKWKYFFFSLWAPAVLGTMGALLFFIVFPEAFDFELTTFKKQLEPSMPILEAQGLTLETVLLLQVLSAVTFAPFINMLFALGEEAGWRGFMYPYLKEKMGIAGGRIAGGIIWAVWHFPIMILAGHNYGLEYWGAPFLGPAIFCVSCFAFGTMLDYVYEKTRTIWIPSLLHGSFNAFTLFVVLTKPEYQSYMILGPLGVGIISMIPNIIVSIFMMKKNR